MQQVAPSPLGKWGQLCKVFFDRLCGGAGCEAARRRSSWQLSLLLLKYPGDKSTSGSLAPGVAKAKSGWVSMTIPLNSIKGALHSSFIWIKLSVPPACPLGSTPGQAQEQGTWSPFSPLVYERMGPYLVPFLVPSNIYLLSARFRNWKITPTQMK